MVAIILDMQVQIFPLKVLSSPNVSHPPAIQLNLQTTFLEKRKQFKDPSRYFYIKICSLRFMLILLDFHVMEN